MHNKVVVHQIAVIYPTDCPSESVWFHKRHNHSRLSWMGFSIPTFMSQIQKEVVILKLDFEKAFVKLEHQVILKVLKSKGFSDKWIKWIENILHTGNSSVLLNGIPGKSFKCLRGVRQGYPLSPLLFVLAVDLLQSIVNKAWQAGVLQHPQAIPLVASFLFYNMLMILC